MIGEPARQHRHLALITERLAIMPEVLGAIVVGSLASGTADACSDIDLLVRTPDTRFAAGWGRRHDVHGDSALACWDQGPDAGAQVAVHRWITTDMVMVEALFASRASGARLAKPWQVIVGDKAVADSFEPRPPIDRAEFTRDGAHPVELAYDQLKSALRSMT
jgi:Nucleotidyltransferase domain